MEFQALAQPQTYSDVAHQLYADILSSLKEPNLKNQERVAFYAFGAGMSLLLDQSNENWQASYTETPYVIRKPGD